MKEINLSDHLDLLTPAKGGKEKGKYVCPACGDDNLSIGPKGFTCYGNECSFEAIKRGMGLWEESGSQGGHRLKPKPKRKPSAREREKLAQADSAHIEAKVDYLWQMVEGGYHSQAQAVIELEQWCKHEGLKDFNPVQLLKEKIKEAQEVKAGKADTILEDQDIEQFRRSLELRESTLGFDVGLVFPPALAAAIRNDAIVSNVSPNGYVAYMLPLALSLLPRICRIRTPDETFCEPPVLFSGIVGDSGAGKTRFERACADWFHRQQETARARYEIDMEDYQRDIEEIQQLEKRRKKDDPPVNRPKPKMPRERKFLFNVATPEAVARKLGHQARGSVWMRGELKGLICGIDQYKGKGDGTELILEYWDAGGKAVDRVDEGNSFYASEGNLSIVGGIQGRAFQSAFTDIDDSQGLAARFLFCQVATLPMRRVSGVRYLPALLPDIWEKISQTEMVRMTLDEAADSLYTDLFDQFQELATSAPYEAVKAWCRKLPGQVLRVAAAVHLIRWGSGAADNPGAIGAESILAAWAWLSHCHDSFTLLQDQMRGSTMASLMDAVISLAKGQPGGVSLRDLYALHLKAQAKKLADPLGKQPADLIREVCLELQANGYGEIKRVGKSDRFIAMEGKP